ncbi:type I secretion C-terminal target domain (VC_A0849 subclass) [Paracoccus halophilus]|uniref:Type I secretion C-terminal target domain (VC_A0849 subclass) n=1 Tax=Paracoccus halophilus TaxID=376733 RepID=A0A1I0U9Z3_9RHOB|nr:calcium-binding protein [Paracoccus halophilus]SFA60851.1 type I secretion C-terminal target domain (VC_A0849 subclass) [Paracoccus halophilus]
MSAEDQIRLDKANGTYEANIAADPKYYLQLNDLQTIPVGLDGNPEQYVALLRDALPEANTLRLFFNEASFNPDGSLHPQFERFLIAAADAGFEFIIGATGGNLQRLGEDGGLNLNQMRAGLRGEVFDSMSGAWAKMLDWLDGHDNVAEAIYGFEIANEPAAYARAEGMAGNSGEFVRMYANHMLTLANEIDQRMDGRILVGGWGYSNRFDIFAETEYRNGTVLDALRAGIGEDLVWSSHLYPTWVDEGIQTRAQFDALYDGIYGVLGDDDIIMTETNAPGPGVNDNTARDVSYDMARAYELLAERGIGIGWFQGLEAGESNLAVIDAYGEGGVRYLHPNSLAHAMNAYSLDETDPALAGNDMLSARLYPGKVRDDNSGFLMDVDGVAMAFGRNGNDTLLGVNDAVNMLYGGNGNDHLVGRATDDHLFGQYGNDTLRGGGGNDILIGGDGSDVLIAETGPDTITGGRGGDVFRLVSGNHVVTDFSFGDEDQLYLDGVRMTRARLEANGVMRDIDNDGYVDDLLLSAGSGRISIVDYRNVIADGVVSGTSGADRINENYKDFDGDRMDWRGVTVMGRGGNDDILGLAGNDVIRGDSGNDTLQGRMGNDQLLGGSGNDSLVGGGDNDILLGHSGNDYLIGSWGHDTLSGHDGHDTLSGGDGRDVLSGGGGKDMIRGLSGADHLSGDGGRDTLVGDAGRDKLVGGAGADVLTGGADADIFVFRAISDSTPAATGRDTIRDFQIWQQDRIDLSALDAREGQAGNQAFSYIGDRGFSGRAGELNARVENGGTLVAADLDGDRRADFAIFLDDRLSLGADSFIL